mmetsp:Transcript_34800/g.100798  ORF Transcript_34800/g.100798 Transcript_34800/m.100798 type:complete len:216 (+) Transcript_34800:2-649(+)
MQRQLAAATGELAGMTRAEAAAKERAKGFELKLSSAEVVGAELRTELAKMEEVVSAERAAKEHHRSQQAALTARADELERLLARAHATIEGHVRQRSYTEGHIEAVEFQMADTLATKDRYIAKLERLLASTDVWKEGLPDGTPSSFGGSPQRRPKAWTSADMEQIERTVARRERQLEAAGAAKRSLEQCEAGIRAEDGVAASAETSAVDEGDIAQ